MKLVGLGNAEVIRDVYTIYGDNGSPDNGIEDLFKEIEDEYYRAFRSLRPLTVPGKKDLLAIHRFIASQLLRTPRALQMMKDSMDFHSLSYERDAPRLVMVELIRRWFARLARMDSIIAFAETELPLLTSDNPALLCKKLNGNLDLGADQSNHNLVIYCLYLQASCTWLTKPPDPIKHS